MKIKKSLLLFVCILGFLIIVYGIIPTFEPEPVKLSELNKNTAYKEVASPGKDYNKRVSRISDEWYIKGVRVYRSNRSYNGTNDTYDDTHSSTYTYSGRQLPTITPRPPKQLPYPRIVINYSTTWKSSLQDQTTENNSKFVIITLEIKNYGYKYFDAYPTKFRIGNEESLVNVSTGNGLDAVIPNNSMTIGDLVFKLNRQIPNPKLTYTDKGYTIIYSKITGRVIGEGERIEDYINQEGQDNNYED